MCFCSSKYSFMYPTFYHIYTHKLSHSESIILSSLSLLIGYLQLVSAYSFATTVNSVTSFASSPVSLLQTYYSNTVYLTPTKLGAARYSTYAGALDCGTNAAGTEAHTVSTDSHSHIWHRDGPRVSHDVTNLVSWCVHGSHSNSLPNPNP